MYKLDLMVIKDYEPDSDSATTTADILYASVLSFLMDGSYPYEDYHLTVSSAGEAVRRTFTIDDESFALFKMQYPSYDDIILQDIEWS